MNTSLEMQIFDNLPKVVRDCLNDCILHPRILEASMLLQRMTPQAVANYLKQQDEADAAALLSD